MVKNHVVKFLVNHDQLSRLKSNASVKGHKTLSSYLRNIALERDLTFEKMLMEIHREIVRNEKT